MDPSDHDGRGELQQRGGRGGRGLCGLCSIRRAGPPAASPWLWQRQSESAELARRGNTGTALGVANKNPFAIQELLGLGSNDHQVRRALISGKKLAC